MLFAQYVAFLPTERIRSQMWRERRERGPSPIRSAKQRAATTRYIYICVHPTPSLPFPPEIIKSWHISSSRENALCRRVSSTEIPAERLLYEPGTESNVLESPDGPDSKGWNPPSFSLFVPLNRPVRHLWSIAEIGLEQLGTFRCFFSLFSLFFIPPPFSSSFPFLLSFSLFFPSLGWMSLFYSGRNKGREPPLLYIYFFFGRRGEEVFSNERANPRAILEVWRRKGGGGRRGGPGFCAESLVNGCPTRAPSLSLYLCLPFLPFSSSADGYRHATPCNTARCSSELRSSGRSWTFQWQQKRQRRPRDPLIQPDRKREREEFFRRTLEACPLTFFSGIQVSREGRGKLRNENRSRF